MMVDINYYTTYEVEKGDTLYNISKEYNINPTLLATLNGLNIDDYIYPNQVLLIPKSEYSYYITKEGDTMDIITNIFNCKKEEILDNNKIYLMEGQLLVKKK